MCFPFSAPQVWASISGELVRYCTPPLRSGGAGHHFKHVLIDDGLADLSDGELLGIMRDPPRVLHGWILCSQRQGNAKLVRASGQAPWAPCTTCVAWWSWDPLWLASHRTSRWAYAWSSWRVFNPRFGAPPEAGRRGQTVVFFRSMVSPRHVFF